jgi:hypothetical protein
LKNMKRRANAANKQCSYLEDILYHVKFAN